MENITGRKGENENKEEINGVVAKYVTMLSIS
jgi:hypothetical protein